MEVVTVCLRATETSFISTWSVSKDFEKGLDMSSQMNTVTVRTNIQFNYTIREDKTEANRVMETAYTCNSWLQTHDTCRSKITRPNINDHNFSLQGPRNYRFRSIICTHMSEMAKSPRWFRASQGLVGLISAISKLRSSYDQRQLIAHRCQTQKKETQLYLEYSLS
jgi:hypothetical protein